MIAHIFGKIEEKIGSSVIVDVHGVGYELQVPTADLDTVILGEEKKFYTYHHVREQSEELFGFLSLIEKKLFELLITVQGVGPKAALAILSIDNVEVVSGAISSGDSAFIARANGVGKKTAERVVVDLSDKVSCDGYVSVPITSSAKSDEAVEALMSLGFNLNDAAKALEGISVDLPVAKRVEQALKGRK